MRTVQAIYLLDGYSKSHGLEGWYRDLTVEEAKNRTHAIYAVDYTGRVRDIRVNGRAKIWKTWPGVELPLKYGYRECFRVGSSELQPRDPISNSHVIRIVVPVRQSFDKSTPPEIVTDFVLEMEIRS